MFGKNPYISVVQLCPGRIIPPGFLFAAMTAARNDMVQSFCRFKSRSTFLVYGAADSLLLPRMKNFLRGGKEFLRQQCGVRDFKR